MADPIKGDIFLCVILGDEHGLLLFIHQDDEVVFKSNLFHGKISKGFKKNCVTG